MIRLFPPPPNLFHIYDFSKFIKYYSKNKKKWKRNLPSESIFPWNCRYPKSGFWVPHLSLDHAFSPIDVSLSIDALNGFLQFLVISFFSRHYSSYLCIYLIQKLEYADPLGLVLVTWVFIIKEMSCWNFLSKYMFPRRIELTHAFHFHRSNSYSISKPASKILTC